jgi:hypothetical protein
VLIKAPRPLPKPERAIAREATGTEFSTQTAKRRDPAGSMHAQKDAGPGSLRAAHDGFAPEKQLKKVLTLDSKIQYHRERF